MTRAAREAALPLYLFSRSLANFHDCLGLPVLARQVALAPAA
jgi:hypothetical protein